MPKSDSFNLELFERANMDRGRSNKIVGQTGEYLVAAELSRRGYIATTFTGNVPYYDIIASDERGRHVSIQVKSSSGNSWQFGDFTLYCDIKFSGKKQIVGKPKPCPVRGLVVVFVKIDKPGNDRYYICTWDDLRDILIMLHKRYLIQHEGVRPKKWDSMHCAIKEENLKPYLDRWNTIIKSLR